MAVQTDATPISAQGMAYEEAAMAVIFSTDAPISVPSAELIASERACHSSEYGYNGEGSTHGMIGIGAPTDTGSNKFKPDGDTEIDPHPSN